MFVFFVLLTGHAVFLSHLHSSVSFGACESVAAWVAPALLCGISKKSLGGNFGLVMRVCICLDCLGLLLCVVISNCLLGPSR